MSLQGPRGCYVNWNKIALNETTFDVTRSWIFAPESCCHYNSYWTLQLLPLLSSRHHYYYYYYHLLLLHNLIIC
ncbi:Mediator of RNA polymerase II transcription subunit [Dirofilaria immitis]